MPNDPIKNDILNIMSGKRKFVPQPKVSKTHALNEDILNLIASKKQAISKSNVPKVDSNLLGDLNSILKPKTQNKNLFGGDFTENVNKILEESKNIPEVVEFIPQPVNESLLGRLNNIFKVQEKKKEEDTIIPLNEEQGTYLKIEKPLTIKDGRLSVDAKIITENLEKKTEEIHQTVSKLSSAVGGGGAVGIVYDDGVNQENLLKSVNNLIFKGPGVELTRKGKDIEVYISSSIDTSLDFPRESTMLSILGLLSSLSTQVDDINTNVFPSSMSSIGGGEWNII
jgi:hypothetical protein